MDLRSLLSSEEAIPVIASLLGGTGNFAANLGHGLLGAQGMHNQGPQRELQRIQLQQAKQSMDDDRAYRQALPGAPNENANPYEYNLKRAMYFQGIPGGEKYAKMHMDAAEKFKPKYHVVDKGLVPEPMNPGGQTSPSYQAAQDVWMDEGRDNVTGQLLQRNQKTGKLDATGMKPTTVSTNVTANADKSFATQIGEKLANSVDSQRTAAQGATEVIRQAHSVRAALDSGPIPAGPGATFKIAGKQILTSLGLSNDEQGLTRARGVITGLANLALAARKELQGQGQITDREQVLLEKARSGSIDDLSVVEIRRIAELAELSGRISLGRYKETAGKVKGLSGMDNLGTLLDVQEPGEYSAPKPQGASPGNGADIDGLVDFYRRGGRR